MFGEIMRPRLASLDLVLPYLEAMQAAGRFASGGPLALELERRHAARLGVDASQVVAVASATSGLTGALSVSPVSRWLVPAFTFAATAHAVVASGGSLDIRDVDPVSWELSPQSAPTGMLRVLPFGRGFSTSDWPGGGEVVVDAAASLGAASIDLGELPRTWSVVFSLQATKVMPCGEGGIVVCGDRSRAEEIRRWAHFRLDATRSATGPGTNALMPETAAAFGLAALDEWSTAQGEWRAARTLTDRATSDLGLLGAPNEGADAHPYWIVRFHSSEACARAEEILTASGIASRRWWGPGLHRMPAFEAAAAGEYPVTDDLAATTLGLPFWRGLTSIQVTAISSVLASTLGPP